MLEYLRGKIRRTEDEATIAEIFSLAARNAVPGDGRFIDEATDAAATFLAMEKWAQVAPSGVSVPLEAARLAFALILDAYGSDESRDDDRKWLQEFGGDSDSGTFSVDRAAVELSYLYLFATYYAIVLGQPQSDLRRSVGDAFLRCLLALEGFTIAPDEVFKERHRRFLLYGEAADKEDNWRQVLHVGEVFSTLCGLQELRLISMGGIRFSVTVGSVGGTVARLLGAEAHRTLGVKLGNRGEWDNAIAEFRQALRLDPDDAITHHNLGIALHGKGDWDGMIVEERAALRLDPNQGYAHVNLGVALAHQGNWDEAILEYREALRLTPDYEMAHDNLGLALARKGDLDGAIAEHREALRINPSFAVAHRRLGNALRKKGDVDGAIAEYRETLHIDPNDDEAHNNLGTALEQKGDRRGALAEYSSACRLDRKNIVYKQNYRRVRHRGNR